jgi:hypothetical protein
MLFCWCIAALVACTEQCGLPSYSGLVRAGVVLALIGAVVTATDLDDNLPLLRANCEDNGALPAPRAASRLPDLSH